jgi:hypothetical protein
MVLFFRRVLLFVVIACAWPGLSQQTASSVPNLVRYSGTISASTDGQAASPRVVGVTFALYKQEEGGAPLWQEVQNVALSNGGRYSVLLGSASPAGLTSDLFSVQEQRWLGVQVEGQPEQPRVLLVSVPYALKAAEADTLAGHSASEFITTEALQSAVQQQLQQQGGAPVKSSLAITAAGVQPNGPNGPSAYINNQTTQQAGASFNIDGTGTAAYFNATSQYLLGGLTVLNSSGSTSLFVGPNAGQNSTGSSVVFVGSYAGQANTSGGYNTFVGAFSGRSNTSGFGNAFVGSFAGNSNSTGISNSFFGDSSGYLTTTGNWNTFLGSYSGHANTTGDSNTFVGVQAGTSNVSGSANNFFGTNSGYSNTTGNANTFFGSYAGYSSKNGFGNTFIGSNAGYPMANGSQNTFIGYNAGTAADPAGSNNIYFAHQGQTGDNGTIRIGDPASQTSAYVAGIAGQSTNSGVPVFIDSSGKLGTGGGAVNFSQVTGTLTSPQLTGTYSNQVTLSNTTNVFDGSFTGNGAGLTGVSSGLVWPIVAKSADYTIQISDFSTATTPGKFIILTGSALHTFTLPNPAPATNGSCVAIGDYAVSPIASATNVVLKVNANGLLVDGSSTVVLTHAGWEAFLYCSDGSNYWRMGRSQVAPNKIGPWLKTVDTGTPNVLATTFVHGVEAGLQPGTMFYLLPINANTISNPTLNLNGLGAKRIVKFGNQPLAPNDLTITAYAHVFYDGTNWQLLNPQTANGTVTGVTATAPLVSSGGATPNISCPTCITMAALTGTTASIGGSPLTAGSCATGTASITGATVGHPVSVSASDGSLPDGLTILSAAVTAANTVTVQLCAVANNTPATKTYSVATQ